MRPLTEFSHDIHYLLTDIDDTLTTHGRLKASAYSALEKLQSFNIKVIPVTGRPAGWCDMIARLWPVDAVIGENGGLYYRYTNQKMNRWSFADQETRNSHQKKLQIIAAEIKSKIPDSAISADQFCRQNDLAIDFCEDIPQISEQKIQQIVDIFKSHQAQAKVSSIHVNGWFGDFNKVTTAFHLLKTEFNLSEEKIQNHCAYVGDSPNDEPLFESFTHSFGVANVINFKNKMQHLPQYVSLSDYGAGFCEIADRIIECKKN